jgi:hypothetical protein
MSEPARDEEWLLNERNDTTLLTLPVNLLILLEKTQGKNNSWRQVRENNMLGVSHPKSQ